MVSLTSTLSLATIPSTVRTQAAALGPKLAEKFEARVRVVQVMARAPRAQWKATAARLAGELGPIHGRGFSAKSLQNLFRNFRKQGAEALLFDYGRECAVPEAFKAELGRRVENNKRVASKELEAVLSEFRAGAAIPGYGTWADCWRVSFPDEPVPEYCPEWYIPAGFSGRNLRRYLPGSAQMELARNGFFDAHSKLPQLRFDYRGLRPLELIVFDDVKLDFLVTVPGCPKACEFWLLVAMDAATRVYLDWVSLVVVPDDEGRKQSLLYAHMRVLVGQLLLKYGLPTGYKTTWVVENAKATITDDDKALLGHITGDAIEISRKPMVDRALPGGWTERHGTPWGPKALIESSFRSVHDVAGALPGQTGSLRVLNEPADLAAMEKEHLALMRDLDGLPAELISGIQYGFLTQAQAIDAAAAIFARLNGRHEHQLQGFEKVQLWHFPEDLAWRPLEELRRYPASTVNRAVFGARIESPLERMQRLLKAHSAFTPVPEDALIPFLAKTIKKVSHPAPYTLRWREDGVEWLYRGELPELASGNGGPFSVKILPHNLAVAYVYTEDGRRLGAIARVHAPSPLDKEGTERALGELSHYRSLVANPVLERHAPEAAANTARRAGNAAIIDAAREGRAMVEAGEQVEQVRVADTAAKRAKNLDRQRILAAQARATLSSS